MDYSWSSIENDSDASSSLANSSSPKSSEDFNEFDSHESDSVNMSEADESSSFDSDNMTECSENEVERNTVRDLKIRIPVTRDKKYNVMRFSSNLCVDIPQYSSVRMKRDDTPDHRREKPWILKVGNKRGKTFMGRKEGALCNNKNYFIFTHAPGGFIDAYPLEEWHTFHPIRCFKAFSVEEAEEVFEKRDKILNYFPMMRDRQNTDMDDCQLNTEDVEQEPELTNSDQTESVVNVRTTEDDDDDEEKKKILAAKKKRRNSDVDFNSYKEVHDDEYDENNYNHNYYDD